MYINKLFLFAFLSMLIYQLITFFKNTVFTLAQCIIMVNTRKTSNHHYLFQNSLIDFLSFSLILILKKTNKQTLIYTPLLFTFPSQLPHPFPKLTKN
jgi:hypothetical protein